MKLRNILLQITGLLASFIFVFFLGEAAIRLYLKYNIVYDVEMTRYAMLVKTDSDNPLIRHIHRPNKSLQLMGKSVSINSDGLRDDEYPLVRNKKHRIAFLGDSFTFGWGVEQDEDFESVLENQLNELHPTEIINFGTGNYNTEQEVNFFIENGLKYNVDKAVLFYFINDAEVTPIKSPLAFLGHSQLVTLYWSKIHSLKGIWRDKKNYQEYYAELYKPDSAGWKNTKRAFIKLKKLCDQNNIELQVVLLPEMHNLNKYPFKKEHALIKDFLTKQGIESLDLQPFFEKFKNPKILWVANDDAHFNAKAHKLAAEHSFKFIVKKASSK